MPIEIEFKFLVHKSTWLQSNARKTAKVFEIEQGYLSTTPEAVVRVRLKNKKAYLTIKGKAQGATRPEFEYEIPYDEGKELLLMCKHHIQKKRYIVPFEKHIWEVDEFEKSNAPLIVAEIELQDQAESFQKPSWILEDVTGDHRYSNSALSNNPYAGWNQD